MPKPASSTQSPAISDYLDEPLRIGEPHTHGALTIFPLFGPEPRQAYVSFAQGRDQGVIVKELDSGASVNDVLVQNPTDTPVLLFEGEEVLGAQQNRTFDVTALVAAGQRLQAPVSCVEAGRWDGSRSQESFSPAPQAAYPEMRRHKAMMVNRRLDSGGPARADQSEVWNEVQAKSIRMGVASPTAAMHDVYEGHRDRLHRYREGLPLQDAPDRRPRLHRRPLRRLRLGQPPRGLRLALRRPATGLRARRHRGRDPGPDRSSETGGGRSLPLARHGRPRQRARRHRHGPRAPLHRGRAGRNRPRRRSRADPDHGPQRRGRPGSDEP